MDASTHDRGPNPLSSTRPLRFPAGRPSARPADAAAYRAGRAQVAIPATELTPVPGVFTTLGLRPASTVISGRLVHYSPPGDPPPLACCCTPATTGRHDLESGWAWGYQVGDSPCVFPCSTRRRGRRPVPPPPRRAIVTSRACRPSGHFGCSGLSGYRTSRKTLTVPSRPAQRPGTPCDFITELLPLAGGSAGRHGRRSLASPPTTGRQATRCPSACQPT